MGRDDRVITIRSEVRIHQGREKERTFQAEDLAKPKGQWWDEAWPKQMSEAAEGRVHMQGEVGDRAGGRRWRPGLQPRSPCSEQ